MLPAVGASTQAGPGCRRDPSLLLADLLHERVSECLRVRRVTPAAPAPRVSHHAPP